MKHVLPMLLLIFSVSMASQAQTSDRFLATDKPGSVVELINLTQDPRAGKPATVHQPRSGSAPAKAAASLSDNFRCDTLILSATPKPQVCAGTGPLYPNVFTGISLAIPLCYPDPTYITIELSGPSGDFSNPTILGGAGPYEGYRLITTSLPANLPYGTGYRIRYHETRVNVYSDATSPFTINPLPQPAIVGLDDRYCQDGPAVTLNGNGSGGVFTVDGTLATTFTPSSLSVGQHTVVYSLTNTNGCGGSTSQTISILQTPTPPSLLSASGQPYPDRVSSLTVSQNTGTVSLSVSGCEGGTINWMGGSATTYAVSTASLGTQTFSASCTRNGCTSPAATATITVVAPTLKVFSRDPDNGQLGNNTLKPYLLLQNDGTTPIPYSQITLRYYLSTENNIPLLFQKNYVQPGATNLQLRYVPLAPPRQGATGYIEFSFTAGAGNLAAGSSSGPIEIQVNKRNYSAFNQLDDYSYVNNGGFTLNPRITAYQNGVLFYGMEPGSAVGSFRQGVAEAETSLRVSVLGNPVVGQAAQLEIGGAGGQPVQVRVVNLQGRLVHQQRIEQPASVERVRVPLGGEVGVLLLEVSTPTQHQRIKLLKQ